MLETDRNKECTKKIDKYPIIKIDELREVAGDYLLCKTETPLTSAGQVQPILVLPRVGF